MILWDIFFLAMALCVFAIFYGGMRSRPREDVIKIFAQINGYTLSEKVDRSELDGAIFRITKDDYAFHMAEGTYEEYPISIFYYNFVVDRHTNSYTIARITLKHPLPNAFLETHDTSYGQVGFSNYSQTGESVDVEGNFNKYFSLKVRKGFEANALEIFTPDVMATLIDKYPHYSFEVINNHFYIYASWTILKREHLETLYESVKYIIEKSNPVFSLLTTSATA